MLEVKGIDCFYGDVQVLRGMSLIARPGEILCGRAQSPSTARHLTPSPPMKFRGAVSATCRKADGCSPK